MQLVVLQYFLEVAQRGSVRKAADRVNITPSAVSRHIAILERMVGAPLFERRPRGMVLTPEGEILHKYAQRTVTNFDLVKLAVDEIRGLRRGVIKIYAIEAIATDLLFPAIRDFLSEHSGVSFQVEIVARDNNDVAHALFRDDADIGIMYKLNLNSDIDYVAEFETPFAVIASPNHPLAAYEELSIRDLAGTSVAALNPSAATRRITEEALRSVGLQLDYALAVNSFEMAKEFARTGVGVTVLPSIATRLECKAGTLVAIPLKEWTLRRTRAAICVHRERPLSKIAGKFVEVLKARSRPV